MSQEHPQHTPQQDDVEDEVKDTHEEAVEQGAERLHRSWPALLTTGFLGGVEISMGLLACLLTLHETGSRVLAGLAFSIGFIALFLAHSELFTEGFYYPIMAVVNRRGSWLELLRLWGVTLEMNLVGGWLTVGLIAAGFPKLHDTLGESAHHFLDFGMSWQGAALAVLTGALVLAGASLFHSVLDSVIIFGAIHAGVEGVGYAEWLGWVWWVIPLNILGGLFFTTLPRVLRSVEVREQEDL